MIIILIILIIAAILSAFLVWGDPGDALRARPGTPRDLGGSADFKTKPLPWPYLIPAFALSSVVFVAVEIEKWIARCRFHAPAQGANG
jgi:hypothetical protein